MVGSARAYRKLKRLRKEHFLDFPISTSINAVNMSGQGGGAQFQWPQ